MRHINNENYSMGDRHSSAAESFICYECAEELYGGEAIYIDDNHDYIGCEYCIHEYLQQYKARCEQVFDGTW